jgi:hypothetical protein
MDKRLVELSSFCKSVENKFPLLNWGACCVFASEVGKHLAKTKSFNKVKIRVADPTAREGYTISKARKNNHNNCCYDWNKQGIYFGHVIVELLYRKKRYHIDSSGVHLAMRTDPSCYLPLYRGHLTIEEATVLASDKRGWNPTFNRKNIPAVKKTIASFFKKKTLTS